MAAPRGPTDVDLASVPMTLIRDENGNILYEEEPVEYVPPRVTNVGVSYATQPPEEAASFPRVRFDQGIGSRLEPPTIEAEETGHIYYGYPCDWTGDGGITNAPLVTTIPLGVTAEVLDFQDFAGSLFAAAGRYVLKKDAGDSFSTSHDAGSGQTVKSLEIFRGAQSTEHLFAGLGSTGSAGRLRIFDNTNWVTHASEFADYLKRYRDGLWRIKFGSGDGWVAAKSSDGGSAALWGAETIIGDAGGEATGLEVHDDNLAIARDDGLFEITTDTSPDDEDLSGGFIKQRRHTNNGRGMFTWNGFLFYPTNDGGLYCRMADGTTFEMGLTNHKENRSTIRGRCTALCGDDNWLYAVWYNSLAGESYLCKAKITDYQGNTNRPVFDWFGAMVVWTNDVTVKAMAITRQGGGSNPRLFMGRSDSKIDYFPLPNTGLDPKRDADEGGECRARATSLFYMPEVTGGFIGFHKAWDTDLVETENALSSARYVDEEYRYSDNSAWASLGRFESDGQAAAEFNGASSKRLQRRFTIVTNDPTEFVIAKSITLSYAVRFPDKQRVVMTVEAARRGGRLHGLTRADPDDVVTTIRNAKSSASPVILRTPYGALLEVLVNYWKRVNIGAELGRQHEWGIVIKMSVVAQTADIGVYDVSRYDSGVVYA